MPATNRTILAAVILGSLFSILSQTAVAAYPLAQVTNETAFNVTGVVRYSDTSKCPEHRYRVPPGGKWTAKSRGACLITEISGKLYGEPNDPAAESGAVTSYTSSGTSFNIFVVRPSARGYEIFRNQKF